MIARAIADKLGDTPGVSYSDIASKALECGRTDLTIRVSMMKYSIADKLGDTPGVSYSDIASKALEWENRSSY